MNLTWRTQKIGNGEKGQKFVGIENVWLFRELLEKYSIKPPKWGQRPKLTLEVTWPLCQNYIKSSQGPSQLPKGLSWPKIQNKGFK